MTTVVSLTKFFADRIRIMADLLDIEKDREDTLESLLTKIEQRIREIRGRPQ